MTKQRRNKPAPSSARRARGNPPQQRWLLFGIVGVVILIFAAVVVLPGLNRQTPGTDTTGLTGANPKALGPEDAPVVVKNYSDFTCPHCATFARDAEKQIIEEFVKAGTVRFEFHHRWNGSVPSMYAHNASECGAEQGKFWEVHDVLMANQSAGFTKASLKALGQQVEGLDQARFGQCVDNETYRGKVEQESNAATLLRINSTPTILVNNRMILGAQPYNNFKAAIEQALAEAGR